MRLRYLGIIGVFFLILCSFSSCQQNQDKKRKIVLPASKGMPSELLLITDYEVEKSDMMDSLKEFTGASVAGIMQYEPVFKIVRVHEASFAQRYITMHTQLRVHIDKSLEHPMIGVIRDEYAVPQTEVTLAAPDMQAMRRYFYDHKQDLYDLLHDALLRVRTYELQKNHNVAIEQIAKRSMGVRLYVPQMIKASKRGEQFLWAGSNLNSRDLNVVLYSYAWDGTPLEDMSHFVQVRDSVMKKNIPGEKAGQWMQTARVDGKPIILNRERIWEGKSYVEVRGMWDVKDEPLGGPFISLVSLDSLNRKVMVAEGFVYSPATEKRDLLLQVEASLLTVRKRK